MDSPYLESGESIVLTTDRVSIDSRQYDLLLTTKYLILIDIRYARFLPEKIPLQTVLSVKAGKIATGDPAITLYFSETDQTGGTDQLNLIFSRQPGEERGRERDEWLRKLMELVVASRQEAIGPRETPAEQDTGIRPAKRRHIAPEMQLPHSTIIESRSEPIELAIIADEPKPQVSEGGPVTAEGDSPQIPPATPSFPEGEAPVAQETLQKISGGEIAGSGSPEITEAGENPADSIEISAPPDLGAPVDSEANAPEASREESAGSETGTEHASPDILSTDSMAQAEGMDAGSDLPEINVPVQSPGEPADSATIPNTVTADETLTDSRIQPISPESVPEEPGSIAPVESQEEPAGAVIISDIPPPEETPTDYPIQPASVDRVPEEPESIAPVSVPEESAEAVTFTDIPSPGESIVPAPAQPATQEPLRIDTPVSGDESAGPSLQGSPEEGQSQEPAGRSEADNIPPSAGSPPKPGGGHNQQTTYILAAAILVLILVIAGIAAFSPAWFGAPSGIPGPVPTPALTETLTPVPSTPVTPVPTPLIIPTTGVWVRVTYPQDFYGRLGNPGSLREVSGSGDRLYQMNADNHLVQVQMYKTDNSGDTLSVEIYRNGELMTRRTTTSPMGFIDLLVDSTTGAPPGIPPRVTPSPGAVPAENVTPQASIRTSIPPVIQTTPSQSPTVTFTVNQTAGIANQTNSARVLYF